MSSATLPTANRIRQIAILVSSVDAAVARQLLLHLPTEMARQVRAMASQLGPISAAEKRTILAEFQKSAGQGSAGAHPAASAPPAVNSAPTASHAQPPRRADAVDSAYAQPPRGGSNTLDSQPGASAPGEQAEAVNAPAWTKLSTEALVRFVRGERTAVVAVVISQLAPRTAVEVLRQLPGEAHRAVLQRLSQLQDIDPTAMTAIDEHLAERLSDYQHRIEGEQENSRRLNALLAAAPPELQQEWKALLGEEEQLSTRGPATPPTPPVPPVAPLSATARTRSTQATIAELYGDAVLSTIDTGSSSEDFLTATTEPEEAADVLPFPTGPRGNADAKGASPTASEPVEFEQILALSAQNLASLLSSLDSPTVLLALAGSTPAFMRRFTKLLNSSDARALARRLQAIGPINLRDVDEAQRRIVERAAQLLGSSTASRRQAA